MSEINKSLPFDSAAEEVNGDGNIDNHENVVEWIDGNKTATVQLSGHRKLNNRIHELAEQYPDEVQICGENEDGSIVAHIPISYIYIKRPARRELNDEQKEELRERLAKARENNSRVERAKT